MLTFHSAVNQHNELQLEQIAFKNEAFHDRHLEGLKAVQEKIAGQSPALAAEIEMQLRNMQQAIQSTLLDTGSSSRMSSDGRRRSEELPFEHHDSSQYSDTDRPRSRSLGDSMVSEDNVKNMPEMSISLESAWSSGTQPRQSPIADQGAESLQVEKTQFRQEPTVSLQVSHRQKSQCKRPCSCQCHHPSKLKTPDFLREITGQILLGYAGVSKLTPPCNEHACAQRHQRQRTAVRVQYYFPVWSLVQRVLTLVSYSGGVYGPEKLLRMSRIRPGLDEVFIQVQSGNIDRLQQLFMLGDASPLDASDTGWTLLHYALTAGQLPTAKFLKDAGADVHAESATRETPADVAWNRILSGCLDETSEHLLRNVFNDDALLDGRQFTTLHKIVLGIIEKSLADELEVTTAHVNVIDSSGYTPLAWASARGDHISVALLLEHGASLNIANDVNAKPIHLAAQTGNIDTIRCLVEHGAEINDAVRQSQMTPIHFAAEYQNKYAHILGLESLGARIEGRDYLSWTPLHWASWRGHLASLDALLDCGADVNAKTLDGNASIILAVANNSHDCVQRLIRAGADCSVVRESQWNVLHYAAIGGTVDTLFSLSEADLRALDVRELRTKDTCQSVDDMLNARLIALKDYPVQRDAWKQAWDTLMNGSEAHSVGNLARSGTDSTYFDANDQPFEQRKEV